MIHGFRKEAPVHRDQFWPTDTQFSKIEPHLPTDARGKARVDDRRVISGVTHVLKSDGRWIDAPPEHGPGKTLYYRFVRWAEKGV
jgi:transposase